MIFKKIFDKLFTRTYYFNPCVQLDEDKKPTVCGCYIRWLGDIAVESTSYKKAEKIALDQIVKAYYPMYKPEDIQFF